jgi:CheY-like chemotaxis protein
MPDAAEGPACRTAKLKHFRVGFVCDRAALSHIQPARPIDLRPARKRRRWRRHTATEADAMGEARPIPTTALVVEDDPDVRNLAAAMLEETEMRVVELESAEQALAYLEMHGKEVGLIFADVWLSGPIDGVDLARSVERRWPWVNVLVTSGNPGDRLRDLPRGAAYLPKPWRALDVLVAAERAVAHA